MTDEVTDLEDRTNKDFMGFGLSTYAMMTVLLTGMVQDGLGEDAKTVITGAKAWLERPGFNRSLNFRLALARMDEVERTVGLLAAPPVGSKQ